MATNRVLSVTIKAVPQQLEDIKMTKPSSKMTRSSSEMKKSSYEMKKSSYEMNKPSSFLSTINSSTPTFKFKSPFTILTIAATLLIFAFLHLWLYPKPFSLSHVDISHPYFRGEHKLPTSQSFVVTDPLETPPASKNSFGEASFTAFDASKDPLAEIGVPTIEPSTDHWHNGSHAMVSSDVPFCSELGTKILRKGGNAADAAITVALCIGSINSHSSGIGGGGFILSRNNNNTISIDARETAPQLAFKDMYTNNTVLSKIGGLAVGIPGELAGLYELYVRHGLGNLLWYDIFEPVIELNRKGFIASPVLSAAAKQANDLVLSQVPQLRQNFRFLFPHGRLVVPGNLVRRPELAKTLELIARNGSSAVFYDPNGPIVPHLVKTVNQFLGIVLAQDFADYHVKVYEPISVDLDIDGNEYVVYSSSGTSCGVALIGGLNFYRRVRKATDSAVLQLHKLIESFKWLALIRTNLGDLNTDIDKVREKYKGTEWIDEILQNGNYSDTRTFNYTNYNPQFEALESKGTSHFSVVDADGNAVAMTTTVNLFFGLMVLDPHTGVILNNEMDDFSVPRSSNSFNLNPSIFNYISPQKRPLSSTAPTIIVDKATGQVRTVIGAAGGSRIPTAILQAIIRLYYQGHTVLELIAFSRLHHQLVPENLMVENTTVLEKEHPGALSGLVELGHTFVESGAMTAMNAVHKGSVWGGVSDYWRKRGEASGY